MTNHQPSGVVLWLTGLSGAGKTTLATGVAAALERRGQRVEVLDGDVVRTHLSRGLGFSREDRETHGLRLAFVAQLLSRHGVAVVVAAISPYRQTRARAREMIGATFFEVHVSTPLAVCMKRDSKGLYKRAIAGEIPAFTGVSDPYEAPEAPELTIDTSGLNIEESVERVLTTAFPTEPH